MFCAGTDLAPFRGFIQQRAIQLKGNPERKLPRALLFVGCRSYTKDRLYADEMDEWARTGAVEVKYAFSKKDMSEGCACVSHRMVNCKDEVVEMWQAGARVYVCGSRRFAESLRPYTRRIFEELRKVNGQSLAVDVEELFRRNLQERMVSDIFE